MVMESFENVAPKPWNDRAAIFDFAWLWEEYVLPAHTGAVILPEGFAADGTSGSEGCRAAGKGRGHGALCWGHTVVGSFGPE